MSRRMGDVIKLAAVPTEDQDDTADQWVEEIAAERAAQRAENVEAYSERLVDGAAFILDQPATPPAVWGVGNRVLWAEGESLVIAGTPGVGKSTIAAQLVSASVGLRSDVLGYPVTECAKVLVLAMDRPRQIARNYARFFSAANRDVLAGRLVFLKGPPLADFAVDERQFLDLCTAAGLGPGDRVVVDSIKDAAVGLSEDRVGAAYNRARQLVLAEGIDVVELHHMKKNGSGDGPPKALGDVYGSTWITSGAGSVVLIHGVAGDPVVTLLHLKQPMDDVGPLVVTHTETGDSTVDTKSTDVVEIVRNCGPRGASTEDVAVVLCEASRPTKGQIERARRRLAAAAQRGALIKRDGIERGANQQPGRWFLSRSDGN